MPFCPKCHDEFQAWVKICPDCGVELVESSPVHKKVSNFPIKLVTVADFQYPTLAYLSQAKLKFEGIKSVVFDDYLINADWLYLVALGGVKLKVCETDAPRAASILAEIRDYIPGKAARAKEGCPRCRSSHIHYETFHIRRTYLTMAIGAFLVKPDLAFAFFFFKRKWKCQACGYEWKRRKKSRK